MLDWLSGHPENPFKSKAIEAIGSSMRKGALVREPFEESNGSEFLFFRPSKALQWALL